MTDNIMDMKTRIAIAGGAAACALLFALGVYAGFRIFSPPPEPETDATFILTALHDRGFLVTQTYVFDQPVRIERGTGSAFKDLFFGQTITARGTMEVNLGIDLASVTAEDVSVGEGRVGVRIPKASLFNARLVGPLEVKNDRGVLKRLLEEDDGYNVALAELVKEAEAAATREELVSRATDRAKEDVGRMVGYVAPGKTVQVEVE